MQTQESSQSLPSNVLSNELIGKLFKEQNGKSIEQLLMIYRQKKNPNHQVFVIQQQKFSNYIQQELTNRKDELVDTLEKMKYLGLKMKKVGNTQSQMRSVVSGFRKYFNKYFQKQIVSGKTKKDFTLCLIRNYFELAASFSILAAQLISTNFLKFSSESQKYIQKQIRELVIDATKNRNMSAQDSIKACALIYEMNLYKYFKIQDLIQISRKANFNQILFFFKDKNGKTMRQLAEAYIISETSIDPKSAGKFILALNLNPSDYPILIKQAIKKSLRYFLNQEPIYSLDMKMKGRPDIAECLVEILIDDRRQKQALHFINKYYLSKYYHLNPTNNRSFNKNVLQKFDKFAPTQMILAQCFPNKYGSSNYLSLSQLGFPQKSLQFIEESNVNEKILENIIFAPFIGVDCESAPVYSAYETRYIQIVQIAVDYPKMNIQQNKQETIKQVYILDFRSLGKSQLFKKWLVSFCETYAGNIVGHSIRAQFYDLIKKINIKVQESKMVKLKFIDVAQKFKQKYNENKSSLEHICNFILHRNLSKFEQCSGWHNRPLRKAQLHYAGLDAALPLNIFKKLL